MYIHNSLLSQNITYSLSFLGSSCLISNLSTSWLTSFWIFKINITSQYSETMKYQWQKFTKSPCSNPTIIFWLKYDQCISNESLIHMIIIALHSSVYLSIVPYLFPRMLCEEEVGVFGGGVGNQGFSEFLGRGVPAPTAPQEVRVPLKEGKVIQCSSERR